METKDVKPVVELVNGSVVKFIPYTTRYGRAEFEFCFVVKRGKLKEIFIFPMQQPHAGFTCHVAINYSAHSWQVGSWVGTDDPKIWNFYWCKEHKCQTMRVYVPVNSNRFEVLLLSNVSIMFSKND